MLDKWINTEKNILEKEGMNKQIKDKQFVAECLYYKLWSWKWWYAKGSYVETFFTVYLTNKNVLYIKITHNNMVRGEI